MLGIRRVVVKLTGKLFDDRSRAGVLREIAGVISRKASEGFRLAVVVGGGRRAREYIELGRELGLAEGVLDMVGIEVSRVNALLLASLVGGVAHLPVPRSVEEFLRAWSTGRVVVLGGLQPGQSTNAVAAVVAELVGADLLVNATDVAGIYDSNPKENPNARLLKEVRVEVLEGMLRSEELAGLYELFDRVAMNIVKRSRIPLVFLSAYDVKSLEGAIEGGEFTGTRVLY
ncbi:MAG: UMP kinase [Desulfurococcaceae archaeon]|nr:UMP kinase [Desulfurococcaceae archaeon]